MRSLALFARLFSSISSSLGRIGFLVKILPFDTFPHTQTGKSLGHVHGFSFFPKCAFHNTIFQRMKGNNTKSSTPDLTDRSCHPANLSTLPAPDSIQYELPGRFFLRDVPTFLILHGDRRSYNLRQFPVVSMGFTLRAATMCFAIFFANLSSP